VLVGCDLAEKVDQFGGRDFREFADVLIGRRIDGGWHNMSLAQRYRSSPVCCGALSGLYKRETGEGSEMGPKARLFVRTKDSCSHPTVFFGSLLTRPPSVRSNSMRYKEYVLLSPSN